ncbi:MAG: hypothetical protein FJZ43_04695 [Candidatus Staskawiczbacteria bacterium]|nr:hypothetical protein [Candidatus Staskawiczbacteria bacterium]
MGIFYAKKKANNNREFHQSLQEFISRYSKAIPNMPVVIFWEMGGYPLILEKNAIIALALKLRGIDSCFIICDGTARICMRSELKDTQKTAASQVNCKKCWQPMEKMAARYGISLYRVGIFISFLSRYKFLLLSKKPSIDEMLVYKYYDVSVGELAWNSTNRFFKLRAVVTAATMTKEQMDIFRRYFYAALVNTEAAYNVIKKKKPLAVFTSHGFYVDYAPIMFVAHNQHINSLSWTSGFRDYYHYYSSAKKSNLLGHRWISESAWSERKKTPLSLSETARLDKFIQDRCIDNKSRDIIKNKSVGLTALKKFLHIDNNFPIVCLFAHLNWESNIDSSYMLFESANEWLIESIKKMKDITNVNWLIKIHPTLTIDGESFTSDDDMILKYFSQLPSHIKVIWSNTRINNYDLYQLISMGITLFGTVGTELPLFGKPILTAAMAHFGNKGFSFDPVTKEEYFEILATAADIKPLTSAQVELARQYAYSYFFQRQIPLPVINFAKGHWGGLDLDKIEQLLPGNNPIIDKICQAVINGYEIILDEKTIATLEKTLSSV